ncbi:MAG: hypothetical protein M0R80_31255 [Proteobacteria bacterium]|nr:hypothetical protein [Pseudomonadota bacterium]
MGSSHYQAKGGALVHRLFITFCVVVFGAASFGCTSYIVHLPGSTEAEKGINANHYVVIKEGSGGDVSLSLLDCYSRPDGVNWNPTCKRVKEIK